MSASAISQPVRFPSSSSPGASLRAPDAASATERIDIDLGDRGYPILIGAGLLGDPSNFDVAPQAASALIVARLRPSRLD